VDSLAIIKAGDILKYLGFGFLASLELLEVNKFLLKYDWN
jgi:hypothetical protein